MFGASYYNQSRGLPVENGFQLTFLQFTDASIFVRQAAKMMFFAGVIDNVASYILEYNPTLTISFTMVSAFTWLGSAYAATYLEPDAQSMLEHFREVQQERIRNPLPTTTFHASKEEFLEMKKAFSRTKNSRAI